jgi:transcriptional repressor NF-X1
MEGPDTSQTPHTNEPSRHRDRNERKPSGKPRRFHNPGNDSKHSRENLHPANAPKLDTAGGRETPSTTRSASPDSKTNDSSTPHSHRKPRQKPKPGGTSDTRESRGDSADKKPPLSESDSKQRRNRQKPDGGTTDASEPKPPRRGKKTAPSDKEPRVDSDPIHDSADAEPPSLGQGPRRKRRGKFDGKLTAGNAGPHQEEHHINPNREKYWVDYRSDDLVTRLIRDLRTSPYLDCAICYNPIRPHQPSWSCSPNTPIVPTEGSQQAQYCWTTLHLKCVRSWALKSISDVRQAYEARGEERPGEWLCIGCRAKRMIEPSSYRYMHRWTFSNQC